MIRRISNTTPLSESAKHGSVKGPAQSRLYKGVTLIKAGLGNRRDKNFYPAETLERAVRDGKFDGMKAFVDHPTSLDEEIQPERSVRDIAGLYEKPRYNSRKKTVEADLRILKSNQWLADTIDELIELGHADKIGLSINGRGRTEPARRRLEEAGGEEVDVNEVKDFIELRSTDIVTEAGAGGGFAAALMESRFRAQVEEKTPMARSASAKALKLLKDGKVAEAQALLEAETAGTAATAKGKLPVKAKAKAAEAEEADEQEQDDQDPLAEAADEIKTQATADADADEEDLDDEDEDLEEAEEDGDEADEDEEDDEDGDATTESRGLSVDKAQSARDKFRAAQGKTREAASRRKIIGATGTTGTVNKPNTHFTKRDGSPRKGKRVNTKSTMGFKKLKPGAKFQPVSESAQPEGRTGLLRENAVLRRENSKLHQRNEQLATALHTYRTTDMASRMLAESDVPERLRPSLLKQMIGMTNQEMSSFIEAEVDRINVIAESVGGRIEGAGSSLRESAFMGDGGDGASGVLGRFVPLKGR